MDKETKLLGENVIQTLCEIYDPEIPVNIYELGLIYDIQISKNWDVKILMTFTAPNCPFYIRRSNAMYGGLIP